MKQRFFLALALLLSGSVWSQTQLELVEVEDKRTAKEKLEKYLLIDFFYTHDYITNTGGIKQGPRNIGAIDLYMESDLSKYTDIPAELQFHFIHIHNTDTRGAIGDAQIASNIDVPAQVDRVDDLWFQYHWMDNFKTLVGIMDISMEFNVTESSLSFLNTSFGTSAEICYSGPNGPSVYPLSTLAVRAVYDFTEEISLHTGVWDADPGDVSTYRSFHSDIGAQNGVIHMSELMYQDDFQKAGLGGWNFSNPQDQFGNEHKATLFGAYAIYEKKITQSFWTFLRYGWANPIANEIQSTVVTGVVYRGIFQRKKVNDEVGLGIATAHFSKGYMKEIAEEANSSYSSNETSYEAYYDFKPIKHISLRPDVQYITNPSGLERLKNAWAMGFRTVVEI